MLEEAMGMTSLQEIEAVGVFQICVQYPPNAAPIVRVTDLNDNPFKRVDTDSTECPIDKE